MAKLMLVERITPKCESFSPKTVKIGDEVWMAENLSVNDGGKGIYFNEKTGERYYTWEAAIRIAKGIPGWHLSTDDEWVAAARACGATLDSRGYYAGVTELKSKLHIKLAGHLFYGSFYNVGSSAYFWSATEASSGYAYFSHFNTGKAMATTDADRTGNAFSVRLVRD